MLSLSSNCIPTYEELKLAHKHRYIIYRIDKSNNEFVVDRTSQSTDWNDFISDLPEDEPRIAIYDFNFVKRTEDGITNKIVFITWSPNTANIRTKMLYASEKDSLRRSLNGIQLEILGTEYSEVSYEAVWDKAKRS
ncbi:actin depolymerizing factor [Fusarium longipes]|uniref:Cofilin n=1 Tax=Fusarium longipes TaxID=694270 RepID=A0A395TAU8_9HYPO|nr:actin depolymerizing factor [Fusarium longipes]